MATAGHYFHWELEFPEVFFAADGVSLGDAAGFDAVVGNPPYVRQEQLAPFKAFFKQVFPDVYHGVADLFVYFFAQGMRLLQQGGRLSYISSNSWLRANYATPLRTWLRTRTVVESVVDLGDNRVFKEAPDVYPAIHIVRRELPPADHTAQAAVFARGEGIADFARQLHMKIHAVSIYDQRDEGWQLAGDAERQLFQKLIAQGRPLGDVVAGRMYRGVLTGLNEAFYIDQISHDRILAINPESSEIIKPILRGEDVRPWYQEVKGRWIIRIPNGWTRQTFGDSLSEEEAFNFLSNKYNAVAEHLKPFADLAKKRNDKGGYWWELRSCDYYDLFEKPKIVWSGISKFPRFSFEGNAMYINDAGYFLASENLYELGVLQSRCTWFTISQIAAVFGERAGINRYQLKVQYVSKISVPLANESQRAEIAEIATDITDIARERYRLHTRVRRRVAQDLGNGGSLNTKLTEWWTLDFAGLRKELLKVWKRDIAVKERDEWEEWFNEQRACHEAFTASIIEQETRLNGLVYELFGLTDDEIALVEASTKYKYGEV